MPTPLFVGAANRVYSIDRVTGAVHWVTELNQKFFKAGIGFVSLEFDGVQLFAAAYGELYCLDPATGGIRWKVPLSGASQYPVTFASAKNHEAATAQVKMMHD